MYFIYVFLYERFGKYSHMLFCVAHFNDLIVYLIFFCVYLILRQFDFSSYNNVVL